MKTKKRIKALEKELCRLMDEVKQYRGILALNVRAVHLMNTSPVPDCMVLHGSGERQADGLQ